MTPKRQLQACAEKISPSSRRVDFSQNAPVYDRRHGAVLSEADTRRIAAAAALTPGARVADLGAGTGRVAIALSELGCDVFAVEPAAGMLQAMRAKAQDLAIAVVSAEGARLPFAEARFDAVVIARLLYLTADWQDVLREASRVLTHGGRVLHEWGNGEPDEEWVQVRERARSLFEEAGVASPFHPGVRSEAEVEDFFTTLEYRLVDSVVLGPGPSLTLSEFLRRLVAGDFSYTWGVPPTIRAHCLPILMRWAANAFDLERAVPIPRSLRWTIHTRTHLQETGTGSVSL